MITMKGKYNIANIFIDEIDDTTREQIQTFLNHPAFQGGYIAIMPDCHAGKGAVIGFTMKMNGYVLPNIVGVDIGCGVLASNIGTCPVDLPALDKFIHEEIPSGFKIHEKSRPDGPSGLQTICQNIEYDYDRALRSIGTLGGGNHFIEVDKDEAGNNWLLVHSGSRNFGLSVANFYQRKAKEAMAAYFIGDEYKGLEFIPPGTGLDDEYLFAMSEAQWFARMNRRRIMDRLHVYIGVDWYANIESVHNYIDLDEQIVRKGAISAKTGEDCIIPLNMRDGAIVGKGKGSAKHNFSAPHGAGRSMSRKKAKETLSVDEFRAGMDRAGIYTTTATAETLDEAPEAYKPAGAIIAAIEETVQITGRLKPIYNFKAAD